MDYKTAQRRAHRVLKLAVAHLRLPPVGACYCMDCGKDAQAYDHRDYARPLDVVPVCTVCNFRRGSAVVGDEPSDALPDTSSWPFVYGSSSEDWPIKD